MSRKLFCDKCGIILEDKFVALKIIDYTVPDDYPIGGGKDLCPKCYKAFNSWLNKKSK